MSFDQTDLDKINDALVRGERVVQFADRKVEYRSVSEMMRVRDMLLKNIHSSARQFRVRVDKGY